MSRAVAFRIRLISILAALASAGIVANQDALAAEDVVIGASLPLSGPLAAFGSFQQWGYKRAVAEVNKAGGILIDGKRTNVRLVIRDDKTDPNTSAGNIETLISRDKAVALLGSSTPGLVNAGALVAERHKIPIVTGADPMEAFRSVRKWKYAWDIFFHEPRLAGAPFSVIKDFGLQTNKKVAILHDNGPDGMTIGGTVWPALAKQAGFEVVQNSSFPIDATQFTSIVAEAKSRGADIVLVVAVTPQTVSLRKQMAAAGYEPKFLDIEKGAEPVQFATALGKLADGVLVGAYWDPSFPYPGAVGLAKAFETETGQSSSQHIADSYAAAKVLLDAIEVAGKTDAAAINAAISATDKTYVVGPIKFDSTHTAELPVVSTQWQNGKTVVVWPLKQATGKILFPMPQ